MAKYLVTGGTGFIGTTLVRHLVDAGHEVVVLSRNPDRHQGRFGEGVRYVGKLGEIDSDTFFTAVINLGGEGIGDKRWSDKRKQVLLNSRIGLTDHLVKLLDRLHTRPEVLISGSAVGWYGAQDDKPLTESSSFHREFTHEICQQWEQSASAVSALGIRLCIIRLGLVLGSEGGVLKRMLPPFRLGLGGRMGSGKQYMSWIHLQDVIKAMNFLVNSPQIAGVFNLTSPTAVDNAAFTHALGKALSKPTLLPMPGIILKLMFGEMGERLLLQGQNVMPRRLLDHGFEFDYPEIQQALLSVVAK